jgi:ABC-type glycerol-3-phosphate transport system permease component
MRQLHGLLFYSMDSDDGGTEWRLVAAEAALTLIAVVVLGVSFRRRWTEEQERFGGQKPSTTELQ